MRVQTTRRRALGGLAGSLLAVCSAGARGQGDPLRLYSYHLKPPFLLDEKAQGGLYPELLPLLSKRLERPLTLRYLPRLRLLDLLAQQRLDGAVLGVSPLWFDALPGVRWTPPLLDDADLLVSRRAAPLTAADLAGRRFARPRGYRVPALQADIAARRIAVVEPDTETSALAMLLHGRVDATLLTLRTLQALLRDRADWRAQLHVTPTPLGRFELGLLVPPALAPEHAVLSQAVQRLRKDRAFEALLRSHLGADADEARFLASLR
jgi:polar amino acid transport system substrate-binding protein